MKFTFVLSLNESFLNFAFVHREILGQTDHFKNKRRVTILLWFFRYFKLENTFKLMKTWWKMRQLTAFSFPVSLLFELLKFLSLSLYCFLVFWGQSLSAVGLIFCPYVIRSWWFPFIIMFSPHDYSNIPLYFYYLLPPVFILLKTRKILLLHIKL